MYFPVRSSIAHGLFTEELVVAVFVLITLLAAALACREKGGLVSLTLVTDRLPKKLEKPSVILITDPEYCFFRNFI